MKGTERTGEELLEELEQLRAQVAELTAAEARHKQAQENLRARTAQIIRHQKALLALARLRFADLEMAFRAIAELDARTLDVERVGIWLFNSGHSEIICEELYTLSKEAHEKGLRLQAHQYPRYFQSLAEAYAIAADDARTDPRTSEFTKTYLEPLGITSMMDVPVRLHGQMVGIVCHEHTGPARRWSLEEQEFAASVADAVALALEAGRRRQAEQSGWDSEQKFRALLESAPDAIVIVDERGQITLLNTQTERMFGYSRDELVGQPIETLLPDRCREVHQMHRRQYLADATTRAMGIGLELYGRHKDGREIPVEISLSPIGMREGAFVVGIVRDISERKKLEEQLRQSQKMEAIGRLAGGVAHDFNNLLTAILGYSALLLGDLAADDPRRPYIQEIQKAGDRAASLTRQLLAFSRRQVLQPKVLNLNTVVADTEKMLRRLIGEDIHLVTVLDPALEPVKADRGQIEQVILNLAVNARDAMPHGGKLTIETANVELDEAYSREHVAVKPGPYVMLAVSDTGHGMDAETQARIFDPFFTTKELGKGTGLGLSTVYGIIKQSGGNIWVYSEPGRGSTFKIYLPRTGEEVESIDREQMPARAHRGSETILLVEDDDKVRAVARLVLVRSGYQVLEARDGQEAVRLCHEHPEPIDLMVTDVVLPEMGGRDLAERLAPLRPEMRVLYVSGYTNNAIVHHGVLDPGILFLEKPFTPEALGRKVREALGVAQPG